MWDCSFIASNRIVLLASRRQSRLPISESKLDHNYKIKTIYVYMFFLIKFILAPGASILPAFCYIYLSLSHAYSPCSRLICSTSLGVIWASRAMPSSATISRLPALLQSAPAARIST